MTGPAAVLLTVTAVAALVDWWAVARDRRRVEYVFKPLTLVALTATALALDPADPAARAWFVVALVLSLAGDVLLMLPRDRFVAGLAAFLFAHVAYVVGLAVAGVTPAAVLVGVGVVGAAFVAVGVPLLRGARRAEPALVPPVLAYMVVISAMLATAVGTGRALAVAGAGLFYLSDALIGWGRFVGAPDRGRLAVMVTYHTGQALLVLSLV
ncbi:MAG TPA: lysoplasmalogenase [Acidimicrobiales bacterium]